MVIASAGTIVAAATRDLAELAATLAGWLADKLPGSAGLELRNLAYPRGAGQSHETILFDADWTEHGANRSAGYVVRIRPSSFTVFPDTLFEEQYRVMDALHRRGAVRVARPCWFETDSAVLGAPFFVMEQASGRVPVSVPPYAEAGWVAEASPVQRRRMWETGLQQLAAIHATPTADLQFLAGPDHACDGLEQEFDKYARFVSWVQQDRPWPVLEAALTRLRSLWPANQPPGLVWGDARLGNIMFGDDFDVVAVMDWEQPSLGGPLNDLGWWLVISETMHGARGDHPHLDGMGTRVETIALWEQLTGQSAADIAWYEDFARLKHSCCNVRMCAMRGLPPPGPAQLAQRLKVA